MKNSKRIKEILVQMAIDDKMPSDMNELDETIFNFANEPEDTWNGYSLEDIQEQAEDELTDDQAREVLGILMHKCDANNSFWDNIDNAIDLYNNSSIG